MSSPSFFSTRVGFLIAAIFIGAIGAAHGPHDNYGPDDLTALSSAWSGSGTLGGVQTITVPLYANEPAPVVDLDLTVPRETPTALELLAKDAALIPAPNAEGTDEGVEARTYYSHLYGRVSV